MNINTNTNNQAVNGGSRAAKKRKALKGKKAQGLKKDSGKTSASHPPNHRADHFQPSSPAQGRSGGSRIPNFGAAYGTEVA